MAQGSGKKTVKRTSGRAPAARKGSGAHSASSAAQKPIRREVTGAVLAFIGLFSFLAYFSIDAIFISGLRSVIGGLVGWGFYIFPPMMLVAAYIMIFHHGRPVAFRLTSALLLPVIFGAMTHLLFSSADLGSAGGFAGMISLLYADGSRLAFGGVVSGLLSYGLELVFSVYGAFPLLLAAFIFFLLSAFNLSIRKIVAWAKNRERAEYEPEPMPDPEPEYASASTGSEPRIETMKDPRRGIDIPLDDDERDDSGRGRKGLFVKPKMKSEPVQSTDKTPITPVTQQKSAAAEGVRPATIEEAAGIAGVPVSLSGKSGQAAVGEISDPPKTKASGADIAAQTAAVEAEIAAKNDPEEYEFPKIDLLKKSPAASVDGRDEIRINKERLEKTLTSFGVPATISDITRGPTVTRYDFELEQGVKLSRITNLQDDIALALGAVSVRIAPIPDKISTVGIEVPNKLLTPVYLRDIIDTPKFQNAPSKLSFALGKNISGEGIVGNIAKLPHLLIAGTTGSGKSVCMNSLIISLLYKAKPDEVKLIMIDPKMVELGIYNGIPHLYIPVVTDPKKAAGALQWAVVEMLKRYRLFSDAGVRDLAAYNEHQKSQGEDTLPRVVVVIDELADLMLAASKEVEESICRVAQMGRAAGMHLVIATQRPSADVITGLMKANIPSRIAFAVSSALESRIILDQAGAEKLVGNGDMLFAPLGTGKPVRIQAPSSPTRRERTSSTL